MIGPVINCFSLAEAAIATTEMGMYSICLFEDHLPQTIQDVCAKIFQNFKYLQDQYIDADTIAFTAKFLCLGVCLITTPSVAVANLLFFITILPLTISFTFASNPDDPNRLNAHFLRRIESLALDILILSRFQTLSYIFLGASAVNAIATICSSFLSKNFLEPQWMQIRETIPLSTDEYQGQIREKIEQITAYFPPTPAPQPFHFQRFHPPLLEFDPIQVLAAYPVYGDNKSFRAKFSRELSHLRTLEDPQAPDKNCVKDKLRELVRLVTEFRSPEMTELMEIHLNRIYTRVLSEDVAAMCSVLTQQIIQLQLRSLLQEIALKTEVLALAKIKTEAQCVICLDSNVNVQICKNGHALHEPCFKDLLRHHLGQFALEGNRFTLQAKDIYREPFDGFQVFSHTEYSYTVESPESPILCPTCRDPIQQKAFEIERIVDTHYGVINNITVTAV